MYFYGSISLLSTMFHSKIDRSLEVFMCTPRFGSFFSTWKPRVFTRKANSFYFVSRQHGQDAGRPTKSILPLYRVSFILNYCWLLISSIRAINDHYCQSEMPAYKELPGLKLEYVQSESWLSFSTSMFSSFTNKNDHFLNISSRHETRCEDSSLLSPRVRRTSSHLGMQVESARETESESIQEWWYGPTFQKNLSRGCRNSQGKL